jgi:L-ascorbate metabolism protein UlaG (beta-lactamase superfamily)
VFVGNATVLLRLGGLTVLTDPTFVHRHEKVSIGYGMHTTRLTDPAMDIADLPPLDFVLLSHFHGDHFDQVAERDLDHDLPIVTTAQAAAELGERGFARTVALDTWDTVAVRRGGRTLTVTATPARHGPGVTDLALPDVNGSVLETDGADGPVRRVWISGDTLVHDALAEIPRRHPDLDLGLVHLGGTRVLGLLVTMDAEQGVEAVRTVDPRAVVPSTTTTTTCSRPAWRTSSPRRGRGLRGRVHPVPRGGSYRL